MHVPPHPKAHRHLHHCQGACAVKDVQNPCRHIFRLSRRVIEGVHRRDRDAQHCYTNGLRERQQRHGVIGVISQAVHSSQLLISAVCDSEPEGRASGTYLRYNASTDFIEKAQNFHFDARPCLAMRLMRGLLPHLGGRLVDVITRVFAVLYGIEKDLRQRGSRGLETLPWCS